MKIQTKLIIFLSMAVLLLSSCVYYNAFFLAEKYYEQGRFFQEEQGIDLENYKAKKNPKNIDDLFEKSITQCVFVIKTYPTSKYVDDAIFLMAKCYMYKYQIDKAIEKYGELISLVSLSEMVPEALYWQAYCYNLQGKKELALHNYEELIKLYPNHSKVPEILYDLGRIYFNEKKLELAENRLRNLLDNYPDFEKRNKALLVMGKILLNLGRYKESFDIFSPLMKEELDEALSFELEFLYLENLSKIKKFEKGREFADVLFDKYEQDTVALNKIYLRLGELYLEESNFVKSLENFHNVRRDSLESLEMQEAIFNIGLIHYEKLENLRKAKVYFDSLNAEFTGSEFYNESVAYSSTIEQILEASDTTIVLDPKIAGKSQFYLAEHYLQNMGQWEKAFKLYLRIWQQYSESIWAPKSLLSLAYISAKYESNYNKADFYYKTLIKNFPETKEANYAKKQLGMDSDYELFELKEYLEANNIDTLSIDRITNQPVEPVEEMPPAEYQGPGINDPGVPDSLLDDKIEVRDTTRKRFIKPEEKR